MPRPTPRRPNDKVTKLLYPDPGFRQQRWAVLPDVLTPTDCARLIGEADALDAMAGRLVDGAGTSDVRRSEVIWLGDAPEHAWLYMRLAEAASRLNAENFRFALDGFDEDLQLARYRAEVAGTYDWHVDRGGRRTAARRKLTLVVQLSDPASYAGGDLEINVDGTVTRAPREQGTATAFPAHALHRVSPVTSGVRHSLVGWLHGPDFV